MLTRRKIARWENAVRQQAYDNARALAVAIVAGNAWMPTPYDLGIVLEPGEIVWHRCPATYRWRGVETWAVQRTTYWGRRALTRPMAVPLMFCLGTTDWIVTNDRLVTRAPDGNVVSIYWTAIAGLSVDLAADAVVLDGADGYHGELSGSAVAPIAVCRHGVLPGSAGAARPSGSCRTADEAGVRPARKGMRRKGQLTVRTKSLTRRGRGDPHDRGGDVGVPDWSLLGPGPKVSRRGTYPRTRTGR